MSFKFIAINGDNVGDSIGGAIATDNHEELSRITGGLKDAHSAIEDWVASVGGETVTSSGDEGIYKIPIESYDEAAIEGLRDQYSQTAGTTLTIGVGDSMSEASKALIYGKLNDKDQVVEYDSHIDDYIASHEDEADMEMPESDEEMMEDGSEDFEDNEGLDDPEDSDMEIPEGEEMPEDEGFEDDSDEETISEQGELSEDDLDTPPEDKLDEIVGDGSDEADMEEIDLDGDGDGDLVEASDDPMNDEDSDMEMPEDDEDELDEFAAEDVDGDGDIDAMMADDGSAPDMTEESAEGGDAIADMIHANMGQDGSSPAEDEVSEEELKQDIIASLQTFKENKPMLEQAKTQNPKLYEATILMLRSMIEMAQKLGMNAVADAEGLEAQAEMPDADMVEPSEDESSFEAQDDEEMPEEEFEDEEEEENDDEGEGEKKKNPFQKSEMTKLYSDLMKAVKVIDKAEKYQYNIPIKNKDSKRKSHKKLSYSHDPKSRTVSGKYNGKKFKGSANPLTHEDDAKRHAGITPDPKKPSDKAKLVTTSSGKHSRYVTPKPLPKKEEDVVKTEKQYWRERLNERDKKRKLAAKKRGKSFNTDPSKKKKFDNAIEQVKAKLKEEEAKKSGKK